MSPTDILNIKLDLDYWERAENIAVGFVIIGVIGEYIADFTKFARTEEKQKKLAKISTLLLILSLAAELICLVKSNHLSGQIIAELGKDTAEAQKIAEREKLDRVKFENQMIARRLTEIQQVALFKLLQVRPEAIVIVTSFQDSEAADYAEDFESVFRRAGWETMRIRNHISTKFGLQLGVTEGTLLEGPKRISAALLSAQIPHQTVSFKDGDASTSPAFQKGVIYLVIEHKPEPVSTNR